MFQLGFSAWRQPLQAMHSNPTLARFDDEGERLFMLARPSGQLLAAYSHSYLKQAPHF